MHRRNGRTQDCAFLNLRLRFFFSVMKIAFLGSRGIPARYSGFETCVENLAVRLVRRGHNVTVYNRYPFNPYTHADYHGVRIVSLPTIPTKATDTIVHTTLCVMHALTQRYDIAYFCGVGNAVFAALPRFFGAKTVINVDGADFARAKWSGMGRWWLEHSERWATRNADVVIADNPVIKERYRAAYGCDAVLIPYGAEIPTTDPGGEILQSLGLEPDRFFLYVSRLTPENAADLTMEAYAESGSDLPLVVVGDAPYQTEYIDKLRALAARTPGIRMTGYLFGDAYRQLSFHARAFILPSAIDATRPVLLEQMASNGCVIVRDTPGNLAVTGEAALTFSHEDPRSSLAAQLRAVSQDPGLVKTLRAKAHARIREHYDWEKITTDYENLFLRMKKQ
jgi:glycosyltransferase involved in cell wall biosynthesis